MRFIAIGLVLSALLWGCKRTTLPTQTGCTKDTDCKGDRICRDGRCQDHDQKEAKQTMEMLSKTLLALKKSAQDRAKRPRPKAPKMRAGYVFTPLERAKGLWRHQNCLAVILLKSVTKASWDHKWANLLIVAGEKSRQFRLMFNPNLGNNQQIGVRYKMFPPRKRGAWIGRFVFLTQAIANLSADASKYNLGDNFYYYQWRRATKQVFGGRPMNSREVGALKPNRYPLNQSPKENWAWCPGPVKANNAWILRMEQGGRITCR